MANSSIAIQVLPSVKNDEQLLKIVDEVIAYIKSFNLPTIVGPFETTIEGDYDELMEILKGCSKLCVENGSNGVMTYAKINYNPKGVFTIDSKIAKHR